MSASAITSRRIVDPKKTQALLHLKVNLSDHSAHWVFNNLEYKPAIIVKWLLHSLSKILTHMLLLVCKSPWR